MPSSGLLTGLLLTLLASMAQAEEIGYSIYSIPLFGSKAELVGEGTMSYQLTDVRITKEASSDAEYWRKTLPVAAGFEIGASIYRERQVEGFGMWIQKNGGGFSWEWFVRESTDTFRSVKAGGS